MSRTYFILCFLLALSACSPKDDSAPAPGDVFIKYFGNLEEDEAVDMVLLDDGSDNVVIAGNYTDRDTTSIYLLVADQNGNLIRENYIRSDSSNSLDLARIRLGSSAGSATSDLILMAGNTMVDDTTRAFWAVANVADLSYQFGGVLELQDSPDAQNRPKSAKATDILQIEQDFVVLGDEDNVFSEGASPSNQRRQVFITRLNANNNRIWRKFQGFSGNDFAESFFLQTNGSFAICGSTDSRSPTGSTGMNMLFLQTDSLGSSLSQRIFGTDGDFSEEARDMVNNGTGFAVIGNTNSGGTT
ncbi:MAG: hypothetical protein KI790_18620, partial [Cyclobacteriaceae bacterium]|nr:hypothetical protein [Cyclobacteriaceae bacterium HetDA_MAG_MS6]